MDVVGPLARKSPCVWVQLTNCISQLFLQIHRAAHARGGDDDKPFRFLFFFGGENTSDLWFDELVTCEADICVASLGCTLVSARCQCAKMQN